MKGRFSLMELVILMQMDHPGHWEVALRLAEQAHRIHLVGFADGLAEEGYLDPKRQSESESYKSLLAAVSGVHIIRPMLNSRLRYLVAARRLRKILKDCKAQVLLSMYGSGYAVMAYFSGFRPYVVYVVGSDVLMASGIKRHLVRMALDKAALVLVNGSYLTRKTRELAPESNLSLLYQGTNTEKFSPGSPPPEPVRIICTRGFLPVYNNEYLIGGLALMDQQPLDFKVTFTSSGPLLPGVRSLTHELLPAPLRYKVEFMGGVTHEVILENLKQSHIYVSLSLSDGTSISLLEALSCGLFPILSDIPQNREWVDPRVNNGILVPLDRPKSLAAALSRAISDKELRLRAREYNRQLALDRASSYRNMKILSDKLVALTDSQRI
jgi:glycosyltransferase involved in cell wall biosynthesis